VSGRAFGVLFLLLALGAGCQRSTDPPAGAAVALKLRPPAAGDPRTYSVGRVQLRALDAEDRVLAQVIEPVNRATGVIDLDFVVPAGDDRRILVEPLGSGILPDGSRTESAIALQAITGLLNVPATGSIEIEADLVPFIPDSLRFAVSGNTFFLRWKAMPIAQAHDVRVIRELGGAFSSTLVRVGQSSAVPLASLGTGASLRGYQVRSVNRFAVSAFSDTLFLP